jgi:hypothetical protein
MCDSLLISVHLHIQRMDEGCCANILSFRLVTAQVTPSLTRKLVERWLRSPRTAEIRDEANHEGPRRW